MWLKGGTYLDTDMEVGPMTFSTDELSDGVLGPIPTPPLPALRSRQRAAGSHAWFFRRAGWCATPRA